jgi:hypothetical protein
MGQKGAGARFLLWLAGLSISAAGCNALLDFDSFTVTSPDAAIADGGVAADADADAE